MTHPDFLIVGGGVIGLSLAWRLRAAGARVTVADAGAAAPPATRAAAGMLAPSFEQSAGPLAQSLYNFSVAGLRQWEDFAQTLEAASGVSVDYQPTGILGVAFTQEEADALQRDYRRLLEEGAQAQWLSPQEARALEPALAPDLAAGLFAVEDAQVDPLLVLAALKIAFEEAGGEFIANGRVAALRVDADKVCGVTLDDERLLSASVVIVASGAVLAAQGEKPPPVFPVKGEATALAGAAAEFTRTIRGPGAYLCPKSDGRLVIGATEAPHDSSRHVRDDAIGTLKSRARRIAPVLARFDEESRWAGLRPGTPDGAPILGPDPAGPDGLVYALGHYRNGVLLAPATAQLLCDALLTGDSSPLLGAFSAARFHG
ncbi:MAG: glycine oxidase ThiO [Pseudomonadota bacterium]